MEKQKTSERTVSESADPALAKQLFKNEGTSTENLAGNGFSYRHDWGDRKGAWTLRLNFAEVRRDSLVFVSAGEGAPGGGKFIGSARYTVHNVAPRDGGIDILVEIGWEEPIRLLVDYLIINP
jgi:hypothetical protein